MSMLFDIQHIKVLHIEPTTACNASCSQCARENKELYDHKKHYSFLTVEDIKKIIPKSTIKNLDKMFMCGNFGDPAAGKHTLEIYKYFRDINPTITLGMNTNGGLKTVGWWKELAEIFSNSLDYVVFSIDGLEDTNHIYRKNVNWNKVIENAKTFITNNGSAHWDMLIFKHNQHQVEQAQQLAQELGFSWFRAKVSKRFNTTPAPGLNPPDNYYFENNTNVDKIDCHAMKEKSLFLAANGELLPCCFMGDRVFNRSSRMDNLIATDLFQGVVDSWQKDPLPVCSNTCGVSTHSKSNFDNQWRTELQLC